MQLTEKLEPYIFQLFFHTAALRVHCETIIKIYKFLIFPLIALPHRVIASCLCERAFTDISSLGSIRAFTFMYTQKKKKKRVKWK